MRYFDAPFEVKAMSDAGEFTGYGSVFGNVDMGGDVVLPGAFAKSLKAHKKAGTMPAMLWQHNPHMPIGVYTDMREDKNGLVVEGRLTMAVQAAKEAFALLKDKAVRGLSIGYEVKDGTMNKETNAYELKEVDLWETSIVTFPMNELAQISAVKSRIMCGGSITIRELEMLLRDAGMNRAQAKAICAGGFKELLQRRDDDSGLIELIELATFARG